jgi:CheY-like chemotaxis protein
MPDAATRTHLLHVLVVDDECMCRTALRRELMRLGYRVSVAGSGAEALALDAERGADLVLTDLLMPSMSGLQLIRRLRAHMPGRALVACTGGTLPELAACRRLAADGIPLLIKPFDGVELEEALLHALSVARDTTRTGGRPPR